MVKTLPNGTRMLIYPGHMINPSAIVALSSVPSRDRAHGIDKTEIFLRDGASVTVEVPYSVVLGNYSEATSSAEE